MDAKKLTEHLSTGLGLSTDAVRKMLTALSDVIVRDCGAGDSIAVPAFGSFEARKRLERISKHPASGKSMLIPPKVILTFKPSVLLKNKVKEPTHGAL